MTEKRPRPRMVVTEVSLVDQTGVLQVAFFKQPWISQQLSRGDRLAVMGKVEFSYGFKQMASPHFEKLDAASVSGTVLPVHPVRDGISQAWMRRIVCPVRSSRSPILISSRAPSGKARPYELATVLPLSSTSRLHAPQRELARKRLSYEEVYYLQLALRLRGNAGLLGVRPFKRRVGSHVDALIKHLPFTLSEEQQLAVGSRIMEDMTSGASVMNRLLLGDVGTGKTAVASVALASVADSSSQACVMAPTGVLAQQYAVKCGPLLEQAEISWALLTGSTTQEERARILDGLRSGSIDVLFGTHAVLGEDVSFKLLSLVVIDEQHRFGVGQRNALRSKGPGADLLVMTATPIPRTLALSVYGDLDTSIIRHRPVEGAGVATKVLDEANRDIAFGAIRDALEQGRQAYVICPLVAEKEGDSELEDVPALERDDDGRVVAPPLHSVEKDIEALRIIYRGKRVEALHGRMSSKEKDRIISEFRAGEIDILVSTTVVEVGVDVPNATVMLIENGERFGLATLHQLRGRVGRGKLSGSCYVMCALKRKRGRRSPAIDRLEALESTTDGFALAEMDLRLRHEGEILGLRQHGGVSLRFVDLDDDADLIEWAHADAIETLRYAPSLDSVATLPIRHRVIDRYGDIFKEVSGG